MIARLEKGISNLDRQAKELLLEEVRAHSGRIAEKLEAAGEVVLEGEIWGRQGTGQAISMDHVIREMARELGEGWAE